MVVLKKHFVPHRNLLRDARPVSLRIKDFWTDPYSAIMLILGVALPLAFAPHFALFWDLALVFLIWYGRWVYKQPFELPFKMPKYASHLPDPHNPIPGKSGSGKAEGILYLGNLNDTGNSEEHNREIWVTNTDARTHMLYLGTTGSGKTEGLKAIVTNALSWGSGFVYVDGKADTDLWVSLFALARRFGRDDDVFVLNYMTANSDDGSTSNTMNPFANGSASYLTNMVVSLMPDAGGDNAMWKERAVALMGALMPALTWKRDKQGLLLDVGILREYIEMSPIIKLSRDEALPERILHGLKGYLDTLPGYVDEAFDDNGKEKPPSPDQPMYDLQVARQQHGYLSMQFTRSLQSLADEYGYIFKAQLADVDVLDVVLNRRILVTLIPSLEKSGDEAANLGKIVVASIKGMMGATLGNTVEGSWENTIGSKQTRSQSSFMTVFDEVGYYTAQGMAVMAAQARSLGFSLIFAAQDLPSMEKRVKSEAQSILANCNIKIFGKLEDPGDTKKFFQDNVGGGFVLETNSMSAKEDTVSNLFVNKPFYDSMGTGGPVLRIRADYDHLREQREGEAHIFLAEFLVQARMFFVQPDKVRALRVHRLLPIPGTTPISAARERSINEIAARLKDPDWKAATAAPEAKAVPEIKAMAKTLAAATNLAPQKAAMAAVGGLPKVVSEKPHGPQSTMPPVPQTTSTQKVTMPARTIADTLEAEDTAQIAKEQAESDEAVFKAAQRNTPKNIDINVVPQVELESESEDITKLKLPEDVSSLIEGMADKFNKGLGDGDKEIKE